jgi:hypothetical protein
MLFLTDCRCRADAGKDVLEKESKLLLPTLTPDVWGFPTPARCHFFRYCLPGFSIEFHRLRPSSHKTVLTLDVRDKPGPSFLFLTGL